MEEKNVSEPEELNNMNGSFDADQAVNISEADEKAQKFRKLANKRVDDICFRFHNLGELAKPKNYHYTPEQVEQIFAVLETQLNLAKRKFTEQPVGHHFLEL